MTNVALAATYAVVISGASGVGLAAMPAATRRRPVAALSLGVVLALCLAAQFADPALLLWLRRDATRIRAGEWYRLITALFLQDGWLAGGVWNIATLMLMGALAEQMLERWQWFAVYLLSALSAEILALRWQPVGAGNSIGVFGLAGAVIVLAPQLTSNRAQHAATFTVISAAGALLLVWNHDIHGAAFGAGALNAVLLRPTRARG